RRGRVTTRCAKRARCRRARGKSRRGPPTMPGNGTGPRSRVSFVRIVVLSQNADSYSTRRLLEAASAAGHEAQLVDYMRCYMIIAAHRPKLYYQGESLEAVDAVIPRIAASQTFYGNAVVRQFEMMGVYTVNRSQAIARSRD